MLDTAIGPVTYIVDSKTFKMNVTHIGKHNKFHYNNFETVFVASNTTGYSMNSLVGTRVKCLIRYRDVYNRLFADVELE